MTSFLESCHSRVSKPGICCLSLRFSYKKTDPRQKPSGMTTNAHSHRNDSFPKPARRKTLRDNEKNNKTRFRFSLHCYPKGPISDLGLLALSFYKTPVLYC